MDILNLYIINRLPTMVWPFPTSRIHLNRPVKIFDVTHANQALSLYVYDLASKYFGAIDGTLGSQRGKVIIRLL